MLKLVVCIFSMFLYGTSIAGPFHAECSSEELHEFRHELGVDRDVVLSDGWTVSKGGWDFDLKFDGEKLITDQGEAVVVYWDGNVLIAVELKGTGVSASLWTFAVNLALQNIVATQVNAYDVGSVGLKSRSLSFDCKFGPLAR